jgi:hypothetical protein
MFMRVNSKCAHQMRPPLGAGRRGAQPSFKCLYLAGEPAAVRLTHESSDTASGYVSPPTTIRAGLFSLRAGLCPVILLTNPDASRLP